MSGRTRIQNACEGIQFITICHNTLFMLLFLALYAFVQLMIHGLFLWAIVPGILSLVFFLTLALALKFCKETNRRPRSNGVHHQRRTSPYSISPTIPRSRPLHLPSMSPPRSRSANHPTSTAPTTNQPLSQYPLSLSDRIGHAYYSQDSSFSSPIIASQTPQTLGLSSSIASPGMWSRSTSSSTLASFPSDFSRSGVGRMDVDAATLVAANVQPPEYPEVVADDPGLPPQTFMTPSTDRGSGEMLGLSTDELPSYEAAMSTWQPPADEEHSTPRDDGLMTND